MNRKDRNQIGQALVELALALPILLMIVVVTLDVGRAYFTYVGIVAAAEQGAVVAGDYNRDGSAIWSAVKGEPSGSGTSIALADGDIAVTCPSGSPLNPSIPESCRVRGRPVTVTVRRGFQLATPFAQHVLGASTIQLQATASQVVR
jgi:TadE-like protein